MAKVSLRVERQGDPDLPIIPARKILPMIIKDMEEGIDAAFKRYAVSIIRQEAKPLKRPACLPAPAILY